MRVAHDSASATSAERNGSATSRCTSTRSTEVQIWPAFAKAPSAAWPAAQTGSTPASTTRASLPPFSRITCRSRAAPTSARLRPVAVEPTCASTAMPGCSASAAPVAPSPVTPTSTPSGSAPARISFSSAAVPGAALAALVDDGVPGHDRRAEQAGGDRGRVVPGRQRDDDTPRMRQRVVDRVGAAAERLAAVQRAELRVLQQRADRRLHAALGVGGGLAGLAGVHGRDLAGPVREGERRGTEQLAAPRGRRRRPVRERRDRAAHRGGRRLLIRDRVRADGLPGGGIRDPDRRGLRVGCELERHGREGLSVGVRTTPRRVVGDPHDRNGRSAGTERVLRERGTSARKNAAVTRHALGHPFDRFDDVARIAVLRGGGIGDLVGALPALAALRGAYPEASITLLGTPSHAALLEGRPGSPVDETVVLPAHPGVRRRGAGSGCGRGVLRADAGAAVRPRGPGARRRPELEPLPAAARRPVHRRHPHRGRGAADPHHAVPLLPARGAPLARGRGPRRCRAGRARAASRGVGCGAGRPAASCSAPGRRS